MTFKRKIYDKFLEWKKNSDGKTALLVEGARRIGKSTIVEEFAKNEYESYILIDFTKASKEVLNLFDDISDLNYIFLRLQLIYHKELQDRKSLIIFDEVQFCPKARQAIKHLVADHRYDYMETGSLISIRKNVKDILIPSEERQVQMYPMDYEEFKWALGDTVTIKLLRESFEKYQPLGDDLNRRMMRDFRLYMLVGGMPKAVSTYIETNNLRLVDEEKRDILRLYESDFMKIDSTGKAAMLFKSIPSQLEKMPPDIRFLRFWKISVILQFLSLFQKWKVPRPFLSLINLMTRMPGLREQRIWKTSSFLSVILDFLQPCYLWTRISQITLFMKSCSAISFP